MLSHSWDKEIKQTSSDFSLHTCRKLIMKVQCTLFVKVLSFVYVKAFSEIQRILYVQTNFFAYVKDF